MIGKVSMALMLPAAAFAAAAPGVVSQITGVPPELSGPSAVVVLGAVCWRLMVLVETGQRTLAQIAKGKANDDET